MCLCLYFKEMYDESTLLSSEFLILLLFMITNGFQFNKLAITIKYY